MENATKLSPPPFLYVDIVFMREGARELYAENRRGGDIFPTEATPFSAGCDLRACFEAESVIFEPGDRKCLPTGIAAQIRSGGWAPFIYSRSGLGAVKGLTVAQGVGVIDPDYTGEIFVCLLNTSSTAVILERGERMAQVVFQPYAKPLWREVEKLDPTLRGTGGFGHSGID